MCPAGREVTRLTRKEWDGLLAALIALEGEVEDQEYAYKRRDLASAQRALRKIQAAGLAPRHPSH